MRASSTTRTPLRGPDIEELLENRAANGRARKNVAKTAACVARRQGLVHSWSPAR
jgi:hypothetical protein